MNISVQFFDNLVIKMYLVFSFCLFLLVDSTLTIKCIPYSSYCNIMRRLYGKYLWILFLFTFPLQSIMLVNFYVSYFPVYKLTLLFLILKWLILYIRCISQALQGNKMKLNALKIAIHTILEMQKFSLIFGNRTVFRFSR